MRFSSCVLLPVAALSSLAGAAPSKKCNGADLTVRTKHATVHGTTETDTPDVRQFLGIPFARPPLGDLRFAPPQPIVDDLGEVEATQLPPACMEWLSNLPSVYTRDVLEFNNRGLDSSGPVSEDCLKVSVWAPRGVGANKTKKLPVLLWVYGGSFGTGGTSIPYQLPTRWVQRSQSHIVVAFNYRVNFFGFPNAAGLPADQQNLGLLDQRLAVEWVRDNIAAFGGDPDRIGLWGESAGAISVGYYSFAYPENPIVNSLFMDSGSEELDISSKDTTHSNFTYVATKFGCGGLAADAELACVRKLDAQAVTDFLHQYNDNQTTPALTFTPVVDGKTVFANYSERSLAGKVAKIPAVIGSNAQDGVTFVPYHPDGVDEAMARYATSNYFFCPTWKAATNRLAVGLPVYRYRYAGNFTNVSPRPWLGAWHGSELPMLFGTHPLYRGNSTAFQYATSAAMQDAWVALVAGGPAAMDAQQWPIYQGVADARVREFGKAGVVAAEVDVGAEEAACPASLQPAVRA